MPIPGIYPGNSGSAEETSRTLTEAGDSDSLSPGVIGAVATVPVLVVICMVAAATLHQLRCMLPRCKACHILRFRRQKTQKSRVCDGQSSDLPTSSKSFDEIPDTLEKSGFEILDFSPPDQQFRLDGEAESTLATQPQLQEISISNNKPRYLNTDSTVSSAVLTSTTPYTVSTPATSTAVSTFLGSTEKSDPETVECSAEGDAHSPSNFNTANFNPARTSSRCSETSGLLSIITLPSFIANDRPRTYQSSSGARIESPIRSSHHHKRSSLLGQEFSRTGTPVSPVNDEDAVGKEGRPASGTLQIITSALKRRSSSSSTRSTPTSSRRSSRRFLGKSNLSHSAEDEAVIEWMRLPPLPSTHSTSAAQTPQSGGETGEKDFPAERLPSYCEEEPEQSDFLALHIPLPPSPSSMVSSLAYALPSPVEISPIKGITTPHASYPPLPPSIPPTPEPSSHPPTLQPPDRSTDARRARSADSIVSLAMSTLRRLSGSVGWTHSDPNTPTTATPALPGNNSGFSFYGPSDDGTGSSIYRGSTFSAFSQRSTLASPPSLLVSPSSPPRPMSPRGPRPLLPQSQLSRNGSLYSPGSSTDR